MAGRKAVLALRLPPTYPDPEPLEDTPSWRQQRARAWKAFPQKVWPERLSLPPRPVTAPPIRGMLELQKRELASADISYTDWQHSRRRVRRMVSAALRGFTVDGVRQEVSKRSARAFGQRVPTELVSVHVPSRSFSVLAYEATERGTWRRVEYDFEFSGEAKRAGRPTVRFRGTGRLDDSEPNSHVFVDTLESVKEYIPAIPPLETL
eukprot:Hpha_TRINITY_DN27016_c0_g1::TRINITY_DN27016_c0_g1_i1::g.33223::m.33223